MWFLYPTFECNLSCEMCYISSGKQSKPELTINEWIQILDLMMETGDKFFDISGGEPFLKKGIFQIFEYIRRKRGYTTVTTNGTILGDLLTKKNIYENLPDGLVVSIDAATADKHNKIRGKQGVFEEAVKCIEKLSRIKEEELDIFLGISLVLMNHNYLDFSGIINIFKDYEIDFLYCEPLSYVGRGLDLVEKSATPKDYVILILDILDKLSESQEIPYKYINIEYPVQYKRIIENIIPFRHFQTPWNEKSTSFSISPQTCSLFSESKAVSPYGDLAGCFKLSPVHSSYAGNLLEIAQNGGVYRLKETIKEFRYQFYESVILNPRFECRNCPDFYYCRGGCRAMALSYFSDLMAVDPRCIRKRGIREYLDRKFVKKSQKKFLSIFKKGNLLSIGRLQQDYPFLREVMR